jgi:NADH-quinone oxidoreductase subunit E
MSTDEPPPYTGRAFMSLTDQERRDIDQILGHYPDRRAAAATALRIVQGHRRWLSDEALTDLGAHLGMSHEELDSLATFGNMLFRRPVGRHVILVCNSFACWSLGYAELRAALEQKLGVGMGQTTADDRFTLLPIVCLGACDRGPAVMIDGDLHGPLPAEALDDLLEDYA